jgi:hypothetical protein
MCTFVPELDGSRLWVLMRDSVEPQSILGKDVPAHAAAIRFPLESLVPGTPGFGLRRLDNLDIRINGQGEGGMGYKDFDVATNQPLNGNPPPDSFAWVSPLEDACSRRNLPAGSGVIDPRFLKRQEELTVQDANRLAARFLFTEGTVATDRLSGFNGQVLESVFCPSGVNPSNTDLRQPTAATVSLKTFIEADSVTFGATTLRTGNVAPPLTLRPFGPANSLRIRILNEEAESLVGLQGPPIQLGQARAQDHIFLSMFEFCVMPPLDVEHPVLAATAGRHHSRRLSSLLTRSRHFGIER